MKTWKNNKYLLWIILIVGQLVIFSLIIAFFILKPKGKLEDQQSDKVDLNPTKVTKEQKNTYMGVIEKKYDQIHLLKTLPDYEAYQDDTWETIIPRYEHNIPVIADYDEFVRKTGFPEVYHFEEKIEPKSDWKKHDNDTGMIIYEPKDYVYAPNNNVLTKREKTPLKDG